MAAGGALVLQLFQLDDGVGRGAAVTVTLGLLVAGAGRPARVDDVAAPADVAHVDNGTARRRPVVGGHRLPEVAEVAAVLRVVGDGAVGIGQLLLDALDRARRDLEHRQRRAKVGRVQHEHAVLPCTSKGTRTRSHSKAHVENESSC